MSSLAEENDSHTEGDRNLLGRSRKPLTKRFSPAESVRGMEPSRDEKQSLVMDHKLALRQKSEER